MTACDLVSSKKRGKRFEKALENMRVLSSKVISTRNSAEVGTVLSAVITMYQQKNTEIYQDANNSKNLKIVIVGGDTYVNHVLRNYVEIVSKKQSEVELLNFYLLPIGKKNDLAGIIASVDPNYRSLFFTPEWREILDKEEFTQDESVALEKRIQKYLDEANASYKFHIGEAQLSYPTSGPNNNPPVMVPFIKGLQIGLHNEETSDTTDLQLTYWFAKKKGEGHKEIKSFQYAAITRLATVANSWQVEPDSKPTPSSFTLIVHSNQKKQKCI